MKFNHKFLIFSFLFSFVFFSCSIAMDDRVEGRLSFLKDGSRNKLTPCTEKKHRALEFDRFEIIPNGSNVLKSTPSANGFHDSIEITQNGLYSLGCHYAWQIGDTREGTITGIAINNPGDFGVFHKRHMPLNNNVDEGYISRVTKLKNGDKVIASVHGADNSYYNLCYWELSVEKLS